ncbi:MAG TPA: hypothetical protein VNM38_00300 [Solirubrobacterales bacterium]|nr:hypothetical protein [Solirubrobacterales bacterium]
MRLANELRAQLQSFWPGAAAIFADIDSPIALAFLERYPSPADARGLGPKRLEGFLARHAYCGRRQPEELLDRLRSAPEGRAGALEAEARRGSVLGLVAALRPIVAQIRELTSQIAGAVRAHSDARVFLPLFKDPKSVVTAARLVAEIGDDRDAIRVLGRAWLRSVLALLAEQVAYDPARHGNVQRLQPAGG